MLALRSRPLFAPGPVRRRPRDGAAGPRRRGFPRSLVGRGLAEAAKILRESTSSNGGDELGVLVHPATSNEEAPCSRASPTRSAAATSTIASASSTCPTAPWPKPSPRRSPNSSRRRPSSSSAQPAPRSAAAAPPPAPGDAARREGPRGQSGRFRFRVPHRLARHRAPSQLASALANVDVGDAANVAVIVGGVAENGPHAAADPRGRRFVRVRQEREGLPHPAGRERARPRRMGVLPTARDAQAMLRDPRKAYVVYGLEPGLDFADQHAALKALGDARVVAFSHYACNSTRRVRRRDPADRRLAGNRGDAGQPRRPRTAQPGRRQAARRRATGLARAARARRAAAGAGFRIHRSRRTARLDRPQTVRIQAKAGSADRRSRVLGLELAVRRRSTAATPPCAAPRRCRRIRSTPARARAEPADASALGIADGAMAKFATGVGTATLRVALDGRVAQGAAWSNPASAPPRRWPAPASRCARHEHRDLALADVRSAAALAAVAGARSAPSRGSC